eukprot:UN02022
MEERYKIVLLGDAAVGKTCLAQRFVSGNFSENLASTIGAAFTSKLVKVSDGTSIQIEIWDTAGQERFRSLTTMYTKGAAGALVVYDVTDLSSLEVAKSFVDDLLKNAPKDIKIMLVGNKIDLPNKAIAGAVVDGYSKSMGHSACECSALTGEGVEEAFLELAEKVHATQQEIKKNRANQPDLAINIDNEQEKKKGCC